MSIIQTRLDHIQQQIAAAALRYHQPEVKLIAVSKGQSLEKIKAAYAAGQKYFGENYLQEALPKIMALQNANIEWHFIGNIQANKTRGIAENFHWVQSLSQKKIAIRLNEQRPENLPALNICIEVNIDQELKKSGGQVQNVRELALTIQQLPRLQLRGLMTIPKLSKNYDQQYLSYRKLYELYAELKAEGFTLDTLSMGMSGDFLAAIAAGSNMVRIGTAIFGEKN